MPHSTLERRTFLRLVLASTILPVRSFARQNGASATFREAADGFHVYPGGSIQKALDAAAGDPARKRVVVHAGTYRPEAPGQALIWFNARHDGVLLEAEGEAVLTAANPAVSDPRAHSHPAIVNHVVYFGDGISRR